MLVSEDEHNTVMLFCTFTSSVIEQNPPRFGGSYLYSIVVLCPSSKTDFQKLWMLLNLLMFHEAEEKNKGTLR